MGMCGLFAKTVRMAWSHKKLITGVKENNMKKLNPLKEKILELSNDTFWYLTQGQEPIYDPQETADELEDLYTMFPYGFEVAK